MNIIKEKRISLFLDITCEARYTDDREIKGGGGVGYGSLIRIISYWKPGAWRDPILLSRIETLRIREVTRKDLRELLKLGVVKIRTTNQVILDIKKALKIG